MGWSFPYIPPINAKEYMDSQLTWDTENSKSIVVFSEIKKTQFNAIIQHTDKKTNTNKYVFCISALQRNNLSKDLSMRFGHKDMDESCGPNYYDVSEKMIKMVEKLIPDAPNQYAIDFRNKVKETICKKKTEKNMKKSFSWTEYPKGTVLQSIYNPEKKVAIVSEMFMARFKGRKSISEMVKLDNGYCIDSKNILKNYKKVS